ncbi:MAG TPA: hypothetical protein DDW27_03785 [Bacteroidales bacterium]|nr:hypothetical protein [Bacteroidales bacterium]
MIKGRINGDPDRQVCQHLKVGENVKHQLILDIEFVEQKNTTKQRSRAETNCLVSSRQENRC